MKKAMMLGAAAALCLSSSASALSFRTATIDVPGLDASLGDVQILPRGVYTDGVGQRFCRYLLNVTSPFNPNRVVQCNLLEFRTAQYPSCIENRDIDFTTAAVAGGMWNNASSCEVFDLLGVETEVTLILGERADDPSLTGVAILDTGDQLGVAIY